MVRGRVLPNAVRGFAAGILASALAACSPIRTYTNLEQPHGVDQTASLGGTIFRIDRTSDLPNSSGHADIFGRKVNRGFIEVRYLGLRNGQMVFRRIDQDTLSNETTMTRSSGAFASTTPLAPSSVDFQVPGNLPQTFALDGVRVNVTKVEPASISYTLDSQSPAAK